VILMVGLGGLEPPTSPLSEQHDLVLQQLTRPRGLPKYAEVAEDIIGCGLDCGLKKFTNPGAIRISFPGNAFIRNDQLVGQCFL
jgi:hypothetical protein